jgi:hypothetical protein
LPVCRRGHAGNMSPRPEVGHSVDDPYHVDERAIDNDRVRQYAAAGWILGFVGGPLPAMFAFALAPRGSWSRSFSLAAAVYWTVAWIVIFGSIALAVQWSETWPLAVMAAVVVVSLIVVVLATRRAAARSEQEGGDWSSLFG